jgi:hypothetical protein
MNNNKTIYKFQHFPFHLVDPSPWPILLSFSLLNLTVGAVAKNKNFSSSNYMCIEKRPLNEQIKSDLNKKNLKMSVI